MRRVLRFTAQTGKKNDAYLVTAIQCRFLTEVAVFRAGSRITVHPKEAHAGSKVLPLSVTTTAFAVATLLVRRS